MYLVGSYEHVIDAKNRLAIPSAHRQEVPESPSGKKRFYARPVEIREPSGGKRRFVELIPEPVFLTRAEKEKKEDSLEMPVEEQDRQLSLFAGVKILEIDEQGRVVMPDDFLDRPDKKPSRFAINILGRDVVLAGVGSRIQVWNAEEYHRRFDGAGRVRAA